MTANAVAQQRIYRPVTDSPIIDVPSHSPKDMSLIASIKRVSHDIFLIIERILILPLILISMPAALYYEFVISRRKFHKIQD